MPLFETEGLSEILELPADKNVVTVSWNLSNVCNYRCGYCEEEFNGGGNPFPEISRISGFMNSLDHAMKGKHVVFEIKGGEPTLWRDLPELTRFIRTRGWHSVVVSNGSRRLEWWTRHVSEFDIVCLSFHPEFANLEKFIQVIGAIWTKAISGVLVAMEPRRFDLAVMAVRRLRAVYPWLAVTPIQLAVPGAGGRLYDYTPEQKLVLNELGRYQTAPPPPEHFYNPGLRGGRSGVIARLRSGEERATTDEALKLHGLNRFEGWSCFAGINRLHIETDGSIYRGQCRSGGLLGSIYADGVDFPVEPVRCDRSFCFCGPEIVLPKRREALSLKNRVTVRELNSQVLTIPQK